MRTEIMIKQGLDREAQAWAFHFRLEEKSIEGSPGFWRKTTARGRRLRRSAVTMILFLSLGDNIADR